MASSRSAVAAAGMLKFIESDASGLPRKRKQVSQACEPCRRRKKRCQHVHDGIAFDNEPATASASAAAAVPDSRPPPVHETRPVPVPVPVPAQRQPAASNSESISAWPAPSWKSPLIQPAAAAAAVASSSSAAARDKGAAPAPLPAPAPPPISGSAAQRPYDADDRLSWETGRAKPGLPPLHAVRPHRFVGDTNPEGLFIEATSPRANRDGSRGGVGVWQNQQADRSDTPNLTGGGSGGSVGGGGVGVGPVGLSRARLGGPHRAFQDMVQTYVRDHCLTCRPPPADYAILRQIYVTKLDPIFPALSEPLLRQQPLDQPAETLIQQVVSLAAASDPAAAKHLRLGSSPDLLDCSTFCASLSAAVQGALDAGVLTDRMLHMRILLVFSLYMHPPGPEDADLPALQHSHAVHQMITLGVHLELGERDAARRRETCTVFCCLWALDRMSAAFYGRATLMHERDFGRDMGEAVARQAPTFRLLLTIIRLMDEVFALYRPIVKVREPLIVEMPIFEQLIIDADANRVADATLATLEVFYHAVAILSCRYPDGSKESAMPAPATNSRRSLSADRITSIVGDEFRGGLAYLPFVPYAVSLSLSVAYRKMRFSSVPMFRDRGRRAFRENAVMLRSLGDAFWTAKALAGMAEKTLREMDKATASLIEGENGVASPSGHPPVSVASLGGTATTTGPAAPMPSGIVGSVGGEGVLGGINIGDARTTTQVHHNNNNNLGGDGNGNGSGSSSGMVDVRDIDVFGHLDPTFDIGAVDAVLDGNLDFGTSSNWFDMQQLWG
ncbi:glucose transport transcription regulator RGT1 [Microdochium nivale]|nr:glucose transport transcription regulator RGT1 [Microdochium nivale]